MEGEVVRKRKGYLNGEDEGLRKLARITGISEEEDDDDEEDDEEKLGIEEGMVAEVMKWLEREIASPSPSSSSSSPNAAFVTINGNEESCGPSFSDSASTVMASVDTRAAAAPPSAAGASWPAPPPTIWPWAAATATATADDEDDEDDEEWLARVLGGAWLELGILM